MVEVTRSNFTELIPEIVEALKNSSFIAIDTEFTGLDLGPAYSGSIFDCVEERYQKLKARAINFIPCQVGLSAFTKCGAENSYAVKTYVFYIRPQKCGSIDKRFVCQASALDFLSCFDFDFNKFVKEGIPFINEDELEKVQKEIAEGIIGFSHTQLMELNKRREQDILISNKFGKNTKDQTEKKWLDSSINKLTETSHKVTFPKDKMCHEYFQLIELRRRYPSLWAYSENDMIVVEIVSPEERKELEKNHAIEEKSLIDYYLGFTLVFRALKEAGKPIVGHNVLMDLMLFYQNFHRNLPGTYKDFKADLHKIFPNVYDTRYIWLNARKVQKNLPKRSGLFELYDMFKSSVDSVTTLYYPIVKHVNCAKYSTDNFPHESGYDSFITGWVFLKICHFMAMKKLTSDALMQPQTLKQHLAAVHSYANKLNVGRFRVRYLNLAGDDPLPQISDLLYICPRSSRTTLSERELTVLFDKYPMVEFKLARNKKSAIMAVGMIGSFKDILRDFKDDPDIAVTKYSALQHSPFVKHAIWLTGFATGCVIGIYITKKLIL